MHDALQAAQAACDRAPKDPDAWRLLGRISRHTGMPAASDDAHRRAAALDGRSAPYRVSAERFRALVEEAARARGMSAVRAEAVPGPQQVRAGLDPDALHVREGGPRCAVVLFQVNHEDRCETEAQLRELIGRSLDGC